MSRNLEIDEGSGEEIQETAGMGRPVVVKMGGIKTEIREEKRQETGEPRERARKKNKPRNILPEDPKDVEILDSTEKEITKEGPTPENKQQKAMEKLVVKRGERKARIAENRGKESVAENTPAPEEAAEVEPVAEKELSPEIAPATPEIKNPFQEQEARMIESIAKKSVEATRIDQKIKNEVDGFLARDAEEIYQKFALRWFDNNEKAMREAGKIIPAGASNEWKIGLVSASKEKGGMGVTEFNGPEYKDIRKEMDKIGVLRVDMKKEQVPPETPFVLLNYLQNKFESAKKDLESLEAKAEAGDKEAEVFAASKSAEIKTLASLRKEIAGKAMGENLTQNAERKVESDLGPKEKYVEGKLEDSKVKIYGDKAKELIGAERQKFTRLPRKEKEKYQKMLGHSLEATRISGQTDEEFQKANEEMFHAGLLAAADDKGIEATTFYALLDQGLKPHEAEVKGFWLFGTERAVFPRKTGGVKEVYDAGYDKFVKKATEDYTTKIEGDAKKELEEGWYKSLENGINQEVERRIKEIAESPEEAIGGVEKKYSDARARIIQEEIDRIKKEKPEVIPAPEKKRIDKEFGASIEVGKPEKVKTPHKTIAEFASDTLLNESGERSGALEGLTGDLDEDALAVSSYFKRNLGVSEMTPAMLKKIVKDKEGRDIYKKGWGSKYGLMDWFMAILKAEPWKARTVNKKV